MELVFQKIFRQHKKYYAHSPRYSGAGKSEFKACFGLISTRLFTTAFVKLQRPGVEDVAVLKKELVQVQTLMDKMTLECEKESEKLKDECKQLRADCTASEVIYSEMQQLLNQSLHVKIHIYFLIIISSAQVDKIKLWYYLYWFISCFQVCLH